MTTASPRESSFGQKRIILGGFFIILLLMFAFFSVSAISLNNANTSLTTITKYNNQKIALAYAMRDSIRKRQIVLSDMYSTEDPFERDEMSITFSKYALEYILARDKLLALPMSLNEKILHKNLSEKIKIAQPLNRTAVELIRTESSDNKNIHASIIAARKAQSELLTHIDALVDGQNKYAQNAVATGEREYYFTIIVAIISGIVITLAASFIAYTISKFVGITNQKLLEKNMALEVATECKTEFLANMSHEIRTPLTSIIGFAQTCRLSNQSMSERHDAVKTIIKSGEHLLGIVNDILDLSKIEANKLEYEHIDHAPFQVLYDVESIMNPKAIEKDIEFNVNFLFPIPKEIRTDQLRVRQILLNLCTNAIKFTNHGYVYINVSYDINDKTLRYDVLDTGIGIPKDRLETIFKPFEQAEASTTRNYGGTGLGLTLSSELASGLGGVLTGTSIEGKGSTFTLNLPLKHVSSEFVHSAQHIPKKIEPELDAPQLQTYCGKVLLAEDNLNNQKLLTIYLQSMGLELDIANNGIEAIQKLSNNTYDIIFMDMRMPKMDGITATTRIREDGITTPIIALTANVLPSDKKDFFKAGCNDFLGKPIDTDQLREKISKHLTQSCPLTNNANPIRSLLSDNDDLHEIIIAFVDSLPNDISNAMYKFNSGDYEELKFILHNIKGVSGNYGYPVLVKLFEKMEYQLLTNNHAELELLFEELIELHKNLKLGLHHTYQYNLQHP